MDEKLQAEREAWYADVKARIYGWNEKLEVERRAWQDRLKVWLFVKCRMKPHRRFRRSDYTEGFKFPAHGNLKTPIFPRVNLHLSEKDCAPSSTWWAQARLIERQTARQGRKILAYAQKERERAGLL
jgi:hypothetical protein